MALVDGALTVCQVPSASRYIVAVARFDPCAIPDPGIRKDLQHIEYRAQNVAGQLHRIYGAGRKLILLRYTNDHDFNAFARLDGESYLVELNAAVPLFSSVLFCRLLSDDGVLAQLSKSGHFPSDFSLPFVVDPADFDRRADWTIRANEIRAFAAGTIADFCSTFVVCHEFGHILSGHVEGMRHYYGVDRLPEFVRPEKSTGAATGRRQAWEYDADRIAAALMIQFVEQLAAARDEEPRTKEVFSEPRGFHLEHTLAICVASLFAFFTYVQGMRTKLDRRSSHPHPYVRATYLKHMLLQLARQRNRLDLKVFHALLDTRMSEFLDALETIGLLDGRTYTRAYIKEVDREQERLKALSNAHRDDCARWRWLA